MMLEEPSTLASVAFRVADTLRDEYKIDFVPVLADIGVDLSKRTRPGARVIRSKQAEIWRRAEEITGDPGVGIVVGLHSEPRDYYVLGHSWLASTTLKDAFERMIRYREVISSNVQSSALIREGDLYRLKAVYPDVERMPIMTGMEAGVAGLLKLCRVSAGRDIRPVRAELIFAADRNPEEFQRLLQCPIRYDCDHNALWFRAEDLDAPLPGAVPEMLDAADRIARDYIASFDHSKVATQVRTLLVRMLPAGKVDQETIASKLYRSASTLQRQLGAEGTSYRDILAETRESLAKQYLADPGYAPSDVAFMLGFADQSNFGRAFKRWTGMSPGEYQRAA
jgi:AraC-like DNA-binding protein